MNIPDIHTFDCYHAGISGGKDSTALALWLRFESGLPLERIQLSMCDTGNEDRITYAFVEYLETVIAPLIVVRLAPDRDFWELARHKGRFPSRRAQFCTQELKIIPTRDHVLRLQKLYDNVLLLNGVRRDESDARKNAARWEYDDGFAAWLHRPLVEWKIEDVFAIHRRYLSMDAVCDLVSKDRTMPSAAKTQLIARLRGDGTPRNPLYGMGCKRVGCFPCVNCGKTEMRALNTYRPERIDFIEQQEREIGSTRATYDISTFFRRNTVPERWRSHTITVDGESMNVPTIRDVAEWAKTARGGVQYEMDFDDLPVSACDIGGMCE